MNKYFIQAGSFRGRVILFSLSFASNGPNSHYHLPSHWTITSTRQLDALGAAPLWDLSMTTTLCPFQQHPVTTCVCTLPILTKQGKLLCWSSEAGSKNTPSMTKWPQCEELTPPQLNTSSFVALYEKVWKAAVPYRNTVLLCHVHRQEMSLYFSCVK